MSSDLQDAIRRWRWEKAVWDAFLWITIGGAAFALVAAILVSPLTL